MSLDVTRRPFAAIETATRWGQLLDGAKALGLEPTLDQSWQVLWTAGALGRIWWDSRARLLEQSGVETVGDMLGNPDLELAFSARCSAWDLRVFEDTLRRWLRTEARALATELRVQREMRPMQLRAEDAGLPLEPEPGMPSAVLRAWGELFGVEELLDEPASRHTGPIDQASERWLANQKRGGSSVLEAITAQPFTASNWRRNLRSVPIGVQHDLCQLLSGEAAARQVALAEEAEPEPDWPDGAVGRALHHLTEARAALRRHQRPSASFERWDSTLQWIGDPPQFRFTHYVSGRWRHARVEVMPRASVDALVRCECEPELALTCPDALAAIDAAIEALLDPPTRAAREAFEADLGLPAWVRAFEALDEALEAQGIHEERSDDAPPLGWRLNADRSNSWKLQAVECLPAKRGGWSTRLVAADVVRSDPSRFGQPEDRAVAELVWPDAVPLYQQRGGLDGEYALRKALALLLDHPRVFLGSRGGQLLSIRRAKLQLDVRYEGEQLRVEPLVGGLPVSAQDLEVLALHRHGDAPAVLLDRERAVARLVAVSAPALAVLRILRDRGQRYEAEGAEALLQRLPRIERALPVQLGEGLRGHTIVGDPVLRVRLDVAEGLGVRIRVRPIAGGLTLIPGEGSADVYGIDGDQRVHATRDLAAEAKQARALAEDLDLPRDDDVTDFSWFLEAPDTMAHVIGALQRRDDVVTEWTGPRKLRVSNADRVSDLKVKVHTLDGWFALDGGIELPDASLGIQDLLAAVEGGRRFVRLEGGDWVRLGDELRSQLEGALAGVQQDRGKARISPLHAPVLQALGDAGARIEAPADFLQMTSTIVEAAAWTPDVPAGLRGELRDYQLQGFAWAARLSRWAGGACLADDMGLGKTIQALALLLLRASDGPALVIAPTSVGFNWVREAQRFAPGLRVLLYRGPNRGPMLSGLGPGDLVVTSWDLLVRDVTDLVAVPWSTLILDEAQAIKTSSTRRAQAARALQARFRLALTGTPIENHAGELWSLFRVLTPGLLGSAQQFRQRFGGPIAAGNERRKQALAGLVRPFMLRRLKSEVAKELPSRTEIEVRVPLSAGARHLYDRERLLALTRLQEARENADQAQNLRFQALADLTRLRQLACHPGLVVTDSKATSSKVEALRELVAELRSEGHAALVFSQFVTLLKLVRPVLEADGAQIRWLDGSTPAGRRQTEVDRFQEGDGDVFLISLKAGGTGLNLTRASYVIHLDPWWNPAAEDQATDRTHRIGQEQPVTVYRLVAEDTVEEGVLELQAAKRALVEGLLTGAGSAGPLSVDELVALLSSEGDSAATAAPIDPRDDSLPKPRVDGSFGAHVRHLRLALQKDLDEGRLGSTATARSYLNVAEELNRWFEHRGELDADWQTWSDGADELKDALEAGTWEGRRSARHQAAIVVRRMQRLAEGKNA